MDAARVFERESGTAPGVDLDQITDRMNIRKAVQSGDVEQASSRQGRVPLAKAFSRMCGVVRIQLSCCPGLLVQRGMRGACTHATACPPCCRR